MGTAVAMFEENIILERDLRIIFVAADEKRKEKNLKYVIMFYSVRVFKVSTTVSSSPGFFYEVFFEKFIYKTKLTKYNKKVWAYTQTLVIPTSAHLQIL